MNDTCQWKKVFCDHCNEPRPKCQLQEHVNSCARKPLECPNSCGETVAYEEIENHIKNDCLLTMVSCLYEKMGCTTKLQKKQLDSHLESAVRLHLDLACVKLNATEEKVKKFEETNTKLEHKIEELQRKLEEEGKAQERLTRDHKWQLRDLDRKISKFKEESQPYVWKIEEFSEIFHHAKGPTEREYALESGYFFSGPNGYRLKALLYPDGTNDGKNTHLSVFFCVMRGKYDAVLPWPFQKTVTFTLIDQEIGETHGNNIVCTIDTAHKFDNDAFSRPTWESNSGYGFPEFISHEDLFDGSYIVDDTLFLKIQVGPPSNFGCVWE
ncbi:TNF receptor-associated factor 6-like [Stylophora pistillata]|uniref:TNF receptor-associated factor 6-like n=1 Tax=Stylophora pistillata TaxID=50429 RepID=UPI000C03B613|nr:TNF receptor-associated factor 6-like [Stylophora pistillata]